MDADATHGQSRTPNADTSEGSGWVTTDVAARAVRVSPRTIRRYIEQGKLKAKPQGEGVRREYLVSVDSLHALRATRSSSAGVPEIDRKTEHADSIADVLRDMSASLVARAEEAAELRVRLQLTEQAQSTIEEGRRRAEEELAEERRRRESAERRAENLERQLQQRLDRQLSAAPREPAESVEEAPEPRPDAEGPQTATESPQAGDTRRPWWRRVFGG
jgi:DNA-binding transcriptional MerR regulator